MASRTSRNSTRSNTSRASQEVDSAQAQQAAQQRSQQQMALAADTTSAMLHAAEVLTRVQLHALQRTGQSWREAAEKIRAANGPMELMAAQNQVMMNAFVQAMQLGQELLQSSFAVQPELARAGQEQAQQSAPAATESISPMMQAWQTMMSPMGLNGSMGSAGR